MAAASGFVTSIGFLDSKLGMDTSGLLRFNNLGSFAQFSSSSSSCSSATFPYQARTFRKGLKVKKKTRPLSLNPKCQVVDEIGSRASSLSALELLKTSAADRKPLIFFIFYFFYLERGLACRICKLHVR